MGLLYCVLSTNSVSKDDDVNVTSSAKTCLQVMEQQMVSSQIICYQTFVITFTVETAQGATQMVTVYVNQGQVSQALIRRSALRVVSDQGLRYVP